MASIAAFFSFGSRSRRSAAGTHKLSSTTSATGSGSPSKVVRKVLCRYGMGCTHVTDPVHRERFWHPPVPDAADSVFMTTIDPAAPLYPCHECGRQYRDLGELTLHLKRKTAWSNRSLVGCRISCLVDNREWQEGLVLEFSSMTGKHRVSLEHMAEVRWMHMLRTAFFIVQRSPPPPRFPPSSSSSSEGASQGGETKEVEAADPKGLDPSLAPIEPWTYAEDISVDYARAQAYMHRAYGSKIQETGHKTQGHLCVTDNDKLAAKDAKSSLLYGELLPRGINKALMPPRLGGERAAVVYELGMGIGKVAMQVFLQFPHMTRVYGVELSEARFVMAEQAVLHLCSKEGGDYAITAREKGKRIVVTNLKTQGILEMEVGNLLDVRGLDSADIVLLETDLSSTIYPDLCRLLRKMKRGARAFTYLDLRKIWAVGAFPFRQLDINRPISDRYATSWSVNRGHHFFLWTKVLESDSDVAYPRAAEPLDPCMIPDELPPPPLPTPTPQGGNHSTDGLDGLDTDHLTYASRDDPRRRNSQQPHQSRRSSRQQGGPHPSGSDVAGRGTLPGWMRTLRRMWRGESSSPSRSHRSSSASARHFSDSSARQPSDCAAIAADPTCQPKAGDMESPCRHPYTENHANADASADANAHVNANVNASSLASGDASLFYSAGSSTSSHLDTSGDSLADSRRHGQEQGTQKGEAQASS